MRQHRERVNAKIQELTKSLDLINYKVGVYEDIVEQTDHSSTKIAPADG